MKAVIKLQEDKLLERKWRKCWEIAEIKEFKENSQRPKPVQIQRKKISAELTREDGVTVQPFSRKYANFTRERTYLNANYDKSILMMG